MTAKMKFREIEKRLRGVPFISPQDAEYLYNLILENDVTDILELGIAHGTATCYMAAALRERGGGHITAVDLLEAKDYFEPSAEEQIRAHGISDLVSIVRTQTGYTWFLHDAIREATTDTLCVPAYDMCIIDGPKNWTIDGAAFFMADKLLREGAWLIFDDYCWSYSLANDRRDATDGITHRNLSQDEYETPQIRGVFELLVKQHTAYSDFKVINNNWAIARKIRSEVKCTTYIDRHEDTYRDLANLMFHKARGASRRFGRVLKGG